jgi:hypothetical protein
VEEDAPKSPVLAALTMASTWTKVMSPLLFAKNAQHIVISYHRTTIVYKMPHDAEGKEAQSAAVDTANFSPKRPRDRGIIVTH